MVVAAMIMRFGFLRHYDKNGYIQIVSHRQGGPQLRDFPATGICGNSTHDLSYLHKVAAESLSHMLFYSPNFHNLPSSPASFFYSPHYLSVHQPSHLPHVFLPLLLHIKELTVSMSTVNFWKADQRVPALCTTQ